MHQETSWLFPQVKVEKKVIDSCHIYEETGLKKKEKKTNKNKHDRSTEEPQTPAHFRCILQLPARSTWWQNTHNFQIGIICSTVFKSFPQRIIHHQVFLLEENIHLQVEQTTIWKCCNLFAQYLIQCLLLQIRLKSNILCMNLCIHIWFFPKDKFQEVGLLN